MSDIGIHLHDEVIVADRVVFLRGHRAHQVVNLIVVEPNLERIKSKPKLLLIDEAVSVAVKHCEGLLQVKVVDVECRGDLVQHFVQPLLP